MAKQEGSGSWLLLLLAAFAAATVPGLRTREPAPPSAGHEVALAPSNATVALANGASTSRPKKRPDPYAGLVHEFCNLTLEATGYPHDEAVNDPRRCLAPSLRFAPLIVSVPDPRESHLALYYDQALVTLRQAMGEFELLPDRFYLPWQLEPCPGQAPVVDPALGRTGERALDSQATLPGLMLFRNGSESLVVAILVTESPVIGVPVPQVSLALEFARALAPRASSASSASSAHSKEKSAPVRAIVPFYSGSTHSFVDALQRDGGGGPRFEYAFETGTATNSKIDGAFAGLGSRVEFGRTIAPDALTKDFLVKQLRAFDTKIRFPDRPELRVAWLSESGTLYGARAPSPQASQSEQSVVPGSSVVDDDGITHFTFPIHVSEIRAEHERVDGQEQDLFPTLRRTLGLKFDPEEEREPDLPKTLSSLTAYEDDLTLAQEISEICAQHFQYLVVQATDPADVVFVAQQSRKYCPDITLVVLDEDELFTHPDLAATMGGSLLAASFAPSYRAATFAAGLTGHPFPNAVSQGFHDASVLQLEALATEALPALSGRSSRPIPGCRYDAGNNTCDWDVYLGQIAGTRVWPLAAESLPGAEAAPSDHRHVAESVFRESGLGTQGSNDKARLLGWPVLFGCLVHLFARLLRRGLFRPCRDPWQWTRLQRMFVADTTLCLVALLVGLPFAYQKWAGTDQPPTWGASWVLAWASVLIVCLLAASAVLTLCEALVLFGRLDATRVRPAGSNVRRTAFEWDKLPGLFASGATFVLAFTLVRWLVANGAADMFSSVAIAADLHGQSASGQDFLALRLMDPFGMSPAMPLLYICGALYIWAIYALGRVTRLDRFPAGPPAAARETDYVDRTLRRVWGELSAPWSRASYWLLGVGGALVVVSWRFVVRARPTFEGASYDSCFHFAFLAFGWLVAAEVVRFLALSGELLELLRYLAAEPMIDAYERIAGKVSGTFGLQLKARAPAPDELEVAVLACLTLANASEAGWSGERLKAAATQIEMAFGELCKESADAGHHAAAHRALFSAADMVHLELREIWKCLARTPSLDRVATATRGRDLMPGGRLVRSTTPTVVHSNPLDGEHLWARLAEDFVAMRFSTLVYQVLHELRHTLTFALVSSVLLVLSVSAYPFQPAHFLKSFGWVTVIIVVALGLLRMVQLERNELLSRLGGTEPEQIEWNAAFVQQLALYVVLPLAAVTAGLFPEVGDFLAVRLSTLAHFLSQSG